MGFSNSLNEREPLLKPRTADTRVGVRSDLEAAARTGSEDHKRVWRFLWYLILNTCLTIGALVPLWNMTNNKKGAGSDSISLGNSPSLVLPQFDFKWTLWRALGGGLSGAAGTSILYIC